MEVKGSDLGLCGGDNGGQGEWLLELCDGDSKCYGELEIGGWTENFVKISTRGLQVLIFVL